MKHFSVPYLDIEDNTVIGEISRKLDHVGQEIIDNAPWDAFPYKPQASFAIAYGGSSIFLKFFIEEKHVRAVFSEPNQPVYKDSCVEFFVSFGDEPEYYNFEFNCAGTCLLSFGDERANRKMTSADLIKSIAFQSSIKPATNRDANIGWELTLVIPFDAFQYHEITSMKGKKCRANFYKCGDDLPEPHFLAWNTINTEEPDFHRPEFFGNLEFN
jgi:hypothetical protein|uniref:carbohydrate-binding family 9-like protein n=1 Tax=Daejeonella sp. TaxID=2805397 RepID=UPI00404A584E